MKNLSWIKVSTIGLLVLSICVAAVAQVDVARRTTAITYPLDDEVNVQFRGTTRFPRMKGSAKVKRTTRSGSRIELNVDNMPRPFELGAGYATYVVWAVSPEGQVDNLGEIKRSGWGHVDSKITVTTNLQTFALIITAEPHFMVTRPSQQIMMENLYPSASNGKRIGTVPSVQYFGNTSDYFRDPRTPEIAETDFARTPSSILQAQQAIALARFAGADRDAVPELTEAESLLQSAHNAWQAGRDNDSIDIAARRSISSSVKAEGLALQRRQAREQRNEKLKTDAEIRAAESRYTQAQGDIAAIRAELARETRNRELAERDVANYSGQLKELRDENGRLREELGRVRLELEAANRQVAASESEKQAAQALRDKEAKAARVRAAEPELVNSLKTFGTVVRNERGIVLTLPETLWAGTRSSNLVPQADGKLTSLAEILSNNPDYRISVESHTDGTGDPAVIQSVTEKRSYAVAEKFSSLGVEEGRIVAKGFGGSVPVAPNTTNANRAKNRRMQVVLTLYLP